MKTIILHALLYLCDGDFKCEDSMRRCVDIFPFEMMSQDEKRAIYRTCLRKQFNSKNDE